MKNESTKGFVCGRCGNCCRIPGFVYLTTEEVDRISAYMGMSPHAFTGQYARLTPHRQGLSLVEREDGSCIFLDKTGNCMIQTVKPMQCEQFPRTWQYQDMETVCKGWNHEKIND